MTVPEYGERIGRSPQVVWYAISKGMPARMQTAGGVRRWLVQPTPADAWRRERLRKVSEKRAACMKAVGEQLLREGKPRGRQAAKLRREQGER